MRIDEVTTTLPFRSPADEVADFLMTFALDFDARERLEEDREAFLRESDLSDEAKTILAESNANTFLGKINAEEVAMMMVVLVLETITTDIIVL
jgi:hypothetical protein